MELRMLAIKDFVDEIKDAGAYPDHRYTMFLGAGCSKSSGIPTAGELVLKWIKKKVPDGEDPIKWAKTNIKGFKRDNPAASYGTVIEKCFPNDMVRQAEIEQICNDVSPSFGCAVAAQLCAQDNTPFGAVLTTNFDDLIADAMFLYSESRPLVIHHAALAEYIRPTRSRPIVVKIHGDARFSPKNTVLETEDIKKEMREQVKKLIEYRGLLFFGYAGADKSVLQILDELPPKALELGVYWINKELPSDPKFLDWLEKQNAVWVQHTDFDETMFYFYQTYGLTHPLKERFDRIFDRWKREFHQLKEWIEAKPDDDENKAQLTVAVGEALSSVDALYSVSNVLAMQNQDTDGALRAYEEAVLKYPTCAPLLNNYAVFLTDICGDHDMAQDIYKRAIEVAPNNASYLSNYANLLKNVRGDYNAAEEFYKRAINLDSETTSILNNYANFLTDIRENHDAAEDFYKLAIEYDYSESTILGNYAHFLSNVRNDHDTAEDFYKRAIMFDSKDADILSSYGEFLLYRGERNRGFALLDHSDNSAGDKENLQRIVQNDIFRAIHTHGADRQDVLSRLHQSLREIRAPYPLWAQSERKRCLSTAAAEDRKWFAKLIEVFENRAEIDELDEWPEWREARPD